MGDTADLPCLYCGEEGALVRQEPCCEAWKHIREGQQEIDALRAALEPFARVVDSVETDRREWGVDACQFLLYVDHIFTARELLGLPTGPEPQTPTYGLPF